MARTTTVKRKVATKDAVQKKYRVRLPEQGTLATYSTGVLGDRMKFVRGRTYVVSVADARKLRKIELLPGRKVFEISEVMPELEELDEPDVTATDLDDEVTESGEVDLTADRDS